MNVSCNFPLEKYACAQVINLKDSEQDWEVKDLFLTVASMQHAAWLVKQINDLFYYYSLTHPAEQLHSQWTSVSIRM